MNTLLTDPKTSKWWYPPGQRTLKISLFDKPFQQTQSLEIGSVYQLRNVRFFVKEGHIQARCGSRGPDANLINKLSDNHTEVQNLLRYVYTNGIQISFSIAYLNGLSGVRGNSATLRSLSRRRNRPRLHRPPSRRT
jgi:hypothetical protein